MQGVQNVSRSNINLQNAMESKFGQGNQIAGWKNNLLLPLCIIKELKFDFFISFLSSIVFGQIAVIISLVLSLVYGNGSYLYSIIKNGDLLAISMALLGTYFAFLISEFRDSAKIFMREVKSFIIALHILIAIITLILLVIIKLDANLKMGAGLIITQIVVGLFTLILSVYSICLINLQRYKNKIERSNDAEKYLEEEDHSIGRLKKNSGKDRVTDEGDRI